MAWDKSLAHRWKFQLPELVSAIKKAVNDKFPDGSGALARSFNLGQIKVNEASDGVVIRNPLPYAEIQDVGGDIPERFPKRAQALHWVSGGNEVFAMKARGFHLQGKQYTDLAISKWFTEIGIQWAE